MEWVRNWEDILHPNTTAIQFIWNKFTTAWYSENAMSAITEIEHIQRGLSHQPFNESSDAHQEFLGKLEVKIQILNTQFPHIHFSVHSALLKVLPPYSK